jgi:hypothetical protein
MVEHCWENFRSHLLQSNSFDGKFIKCQKRMTSVPQRKVQNRQKIKSWYLSREPPLLVKRYVTVLYTAGLFKSCIIKLATHVDTDPLGNVGGSSPKGSE